MKITLSCVKLEPAEGTAVKKLAESCREEASRDKGGWIIDFLAEEAPGFVLLVLAHREAPGSMRVKGLLGEIKSSKPNPLLAEMEFDEASGESVIVVHDAEKEANDFNRMIYKAFADPLSTTGLALDGRMRAGFKFDVYDGEGLGHSVFDAPEDSYDIAALIGYGGCVIRRVFRKTGEIAALIVYAGNGRILLARCGEGFPSGNDVLRPFAGKGFKRQWALHFSVREGILAKTSVAKEAAEKTDLLPRVLGSLKGKFRKV